MRLQHLAPAAVLLAIACSSGGGSSEPSGYRLVNDTPAAVVVHGCGSGCEGTSLKSGEHVDFQEPLLRVRLVKADGSATCWMIARGIIPATPPPRENLTVSGASTAAC